MAEELGLIIVIGILFLFLNFLLRGINIARSARDDFGKLLGAGIVAWIGYQTLAHIGANIALVPLTGVPMPFFSYGGTALASLFAAIGIMANISKTAADRVIRAENPAVNFLNLTEFFNGCKMYTL